MVRLIRLGLIGPPEDEGNEYQPACKYECPNVNCSSVFKNKSSLTKHLRSACGKAVNYECPYCDYLSPIKRLFTRHLKRHDRQQRPGPLSSKKTEAPKKSSKTVKSRFYACPNSNCSIKFSTKCDLTYHYKFNCGKPPRFRCPYCEFRAKNGFDVRRHIRNVHPHLDVWIIKGNQTVLA